MFQVHGKFRFVGLLLSLAMVAGACGSTPTDDSGGTTTSANPGANPVDGETEGGASTGMCAVEVPDCNDTVVVDDDAD